MFKFKSDCKKFQLLGFYKNLIVPEKATPIYYYYYYYY